MYAFLFSLFTPTFALPRQGRGNLFLRQSLVTYALLHILYPYAFCKIRLDGLTQE